MAFKTAPRVASLSPNQAKHAKKFTAAPTPIEAAHGDALKRAKSQKDSDAEKAVKQILGEADVKAKYKIEVFFGPDRTLRGPNLCQVQFFESGKKVHGGGDQLMWLCRNPEDSRLGCGAFIPGDAIRDGVAVCPGCGKAIKATALTERLYARISTRNLAASLAIWFRRLNHSADIYCKYDPQDVRYLAMVKRLGAQKAHRLRGLHLYPLRNILKETSVGASLEDRFFAFLTA